MTHHHIYGGSNAATWVECNGSPYLSKLAESEPNEPMKRGTRIHEKAAEILNRQPTTPDLIYDEMEVVKKYIEAINHFIFNNYQIEIEGYYTNSPELGGTVDGLYCNDTEIRIWDLKTGHTPVSPVNNYQMLFYLWLSFKDTMFDRSVWLGIWHEAFGEFQWWNPTHEEIQAAFAKFELATTTKKQLTPGPHCAKCRAVGICNKTSQIPISKSDERIAADYELIPVWEAIIKSVESVAEILCATGRLPGYRIGSGKKKPLKWLSPPPLQIANVEVYVKEALSPTQVAKLLGKDGENFIVSSALASRPPSEEVIVKI